MLHRDAPKLHPEQVQNAKLLAGREDFIHLLPKNINFVEVGVALGDFSELILTACEPKKYFALDMFDMHRWPETWDGRVGRELGEMSHYDYFRKKFFASIEAGVTDLMAGDSVSSLAKLPKNFADVIYLDSDHTYEHVVKELEIAKDVVKDDGVIVLNDYIAHDHYRNMPYGVTAAGTEFMIREGWEAIYFALHPQMFCDLIIRKKKA